MQRVLTRRFAREIASVGSTIRFLTGTRKLKSIPHCECGGWLRCVGAIGKNGYDPLLLEFVCVRCRRQVWFHGSVLSKEIIGKLTVRS